MGGLSKGGACDASGTGKHLSLAVACVNRAHATAPTTASEVREAGDNAARSRDAAYKRSRPVLR